MNELENLVNGDETALAAFGYAPLHEQEALLGAATPVQRQAILRKAAAPKATINSGLEATSRDEALRRIDALPAAIKAGLMAKRLQIADAAFYFYKAGGAQSSLRMIGTDDDKAVGVTNVSDAKLDKDYYFLPVWLQVLSGNNATLSDTAFGLPVDAILNGDFEWKANGKYLMPKDTSARIFDTASRTNVIIGSHKVNNPKWIEPQVEMQFDIRASQALPANENVALVIHGAVVIPY